MQSDVWDGGRQVGVWERVSAELTRLGAVETVEGQVALALAGQLDSPRNGMATAGDAKQLLAVMEVLRSRSVQEADSVDDTRDATLHILKSVG